MQRTGSRAIKAEDVWFKTGAIKVGGEGDELRFNASCHERIGDIQYPNHSLSDSRWGIELSPVGIDSTREPVCE